MTNPGEEAQDDPEEEEKNDKLIKTCGQCEFAYETLAEIMFHVKNTPEHSPQCVHCKSTFADFANYRKHLTKFHMKKGDIICSECGKISKTEEQARFHRNNVHKLEDDLFCNICGSQQPNLSKLRNVSVMTFKSFYIFSRESDSRIANVCLSSEIKTPLTSDILSYLSSLLTIEPMTMESITHRAH